MGNAAEWLRVRVQQEQVRVYGPDAKKVTIRVSPEDYDALSGIAALANRSRSATVEDLFLLALKDAVEEAARIEQEREAGTSMNVSQVVNDEGETELHSPEGEVVGVML